MNIDAVNGFSLRNLSRINVLLGKNGCGKSYLLKRVEQALDRNLFGRIRYISPERGGVLSYEPNIEHSMTSNPTWMAETRRNNQTANFRQQSATLFRRLELLFLRRIEKNHLLPDYKPQTFVEIIDPISDLLDRVKIERDNIKAFRIIDRETGVEAQPNEISSGEAELISLGIECLSFLHECEEDKNNILFIDEPDVHLHPDLQDRLARFIRKVFDNSSAILVLATHSTALLAGLAENTETHVAFMRRKDTTLSFKPVSHVDRAILPIFGAHPLSNIFNEAPILLIEGEDDERVWQQAVRSSDGRIRVYPCVVDGNSGFNEFETEVNKIIEAVYDRARGFSLRDRDLDPEVINDIGQLVRMRLSCRAAENMMLSDDVLKLASTDWLRLEGLINNWIEANAPHQYHSAMVDFQDGGFNRKGHDLKAIRNILIGLYSNKPWEVLVGQAIAQLVKAEPCTGAHSLQDYLGAKVCRVVLGLGT